MALYTVSLGSNVEEGEENLRRALKWLKALFPSLSSSNIYPTIPVGHAKGRYVNAVAQFESELTPESLDRVFKEYEHSMGRDDRSRELGIVPLDLDIVLENSNVLRPWEFEQDFFRRGYGEVRGRDKVRDKGQEIRVENQKI